MTAPLPWTDWALSPYLFVAVTVATMLSPSSSKNGAASSLKIGIVHLVNATI